MSKPAEYITLKDGTQVGMTRPSSITDQDWAQVKQWCVENPEKAKLMQSSIKDLTDNPMRLEQFREVMALAELMKNDKSYPGRFQALATDPAFAGAFNEMKAGGMDAVMKYYNDEGFLRAISQKMGGVPKEMMDAGRNIHDCIRAGDLAGVQKLLSVGINPNVKDARGISALHYAVGVNRLDILKVLMDAQADPKVVDGQGNTLLHYAAGYGHVQTTDYFLQCGLQVNQANLAGETPLDLALRNNHTAVVSSLRAKGAQPGRK